MKRKGYTFAFEADPETLAVKGNAAAYDDEDLNAHIEKEIYDRLDNGDIFAWFCAKVTCTHNKSGVQGVDYLGGCSYKDAASFLADQHYKDMCAEAFHNCQDELARLRKAIRK